MLEKKRLELELEYIENGLSEKALKLSRELDNLVLNEQKKLLKLHKKSMKFIVA